MKTQTIQIGMRTVEAPIVNGQPLLLLPDMRDLLKIRIYQQKALIAKNEVNKLPAQRRKLTDLEAMLTDVELQIVQKEIEKAKEDKNPTELLGHLNEKIELAMQLGKR